MSSRKHKETAGFTLIEVIAALLLLSVVAALVVPRMLETSAGVIAEADRMRANLRYAQSLAMAANTADWAVRIDSGSYQLLRNGEPSPIGWADGSGSVRVMSSGVQVSGGTGTLALDTMGAPSSTYTIQLTDGARLETVTVTGFTGLIP